MGSILICPFVYDSINSLYHSACSEVHFNIDVIMYGSFGPLFSSMKSISSSQCLKSVYEAWSHLGVSTISLRFDTEPNASMNAEFGNSGRVLVACLLARMPKSIPGDLLPRLTFFLSSRMSLEHFFKNISIHCRRFDSALSKLNNGGQFPNVFKKSAATVSQCRGPSQPFFKRFCPLIMDRCFFSRNPATHTFFHLLNAL